MELNFSSDRNWHEFKRPWRRSKKGLRVPIPSKKNRNVGVIAFLGHTNGFFGNIESTSNFYWSSRSTPMPERSKVQSSVFCRIFIQWVSWCISPGCATVFWLIFCVMGNSGRLEIYGTKQFWKMNKHEINPCITYSESSSLWFTYIWYIYTWQPLGPLLKVKLLVGYR